MLAMSPTDLAPAPTQAPPADAAAPPAADTPPRPTAEDCEHIEHLRVHVYSNLAAAILPFLLLGFAAVQLWNRALHWQDLVIFFVMYIPIGLGVTVGFHRLFTHRSFKTGPTVRFIFGALGSAALEGPLIAWVADHRKHHAFSDSEGDPHSPHVDHDGDHLSPWKGLWHAHLGWTALPTQRGARARYAPDLMADPVARFLDKTWYVWVLLGLAIPFGLGWLLTGTIDGALTGLLWGGVVRIFVLHHATFSVNSVCHYLGERRFETGDESRNVAWLAPMTLGESWHNNHHAFPTSAEHGLKWWELDPSRMTINTLERLGLAWDVVRISPERQERKAVVTTT
jgi:stearoyl-CoA desaturase (Delta-9 desaturase)